MVVTEMDESKPDLTDADYDAIAEIPEVREAVERFRELHTAYMNAVRQLVRESYGRKLPRLVRINKEHLPAINRQIDIVADLVEKNS